MSFIVRELNNKVPFGTKLNQMRRRLAISLDMAAEATRVQRHYLEALEKNDFITLPEAIYTRNFIKTYVSYLGGDVGYFLKCYEQECG
ncbi:MAG: helix-turn-helix domain-containing protein, partial [Candidatus Uhrbacteria bacterium]